MHIKDLYRKVADFEAGLSDEVSTRLHCRKECSRCCYTDISVFEVEAANIRKWFHALTPDEKNEVIQKWKSPGKFMENFQEEKVQSCIFLHQETCSIYEARPLICRTQGLALKFNEGENTFLDICPLNEDVLPRMNPSEILNLDLMNMILSQMEKLDAQNEERKRIKLIALRNQLWTE